MDVSVIIPTYNRRALLLLALRSVLDQTSPPREILVVDDGSTDGTKEALESVQGIRVLTQANAGAAAARNLGLRFASCPWVAFLDSDDLWEPTKLEKQFAAHSAHPERRWVICDSRSIREDGSPLQGHRKPLHGGAITTALFQHTFVHTPSVLAERALLLDLGGFDESLRVCEDLDLWLRASLESEVVAVHEPLFLRRVHANSLAHTDNPEHHEDKCRVLERFAQLPQAQALLNTWVRNKRLARVHFLAARAWRRHQDQDRAHAHLKRSRSLCPLHPRYWPILSSIS